MNLKRGARRRATKTGAGATAAALALLLQAVPAQGQFSTAEKPGLSITAEAGGLLPNTELQSDKWSSNSALTLRGGLSPRWQWSLSGAFAELSGDDYKTDLFSFAPGIVYSPILSSSFNLSLRLDVGAGRYAIDIFPPAATRGIKASGFTAVVPVGAEAGIRLSRKVALLFKGTFHYTLSDELNGAALKKGNDTYLTFNAGIALGSFGAPAPPALRFAAPEVDVGRPEIPAVPREIEKAEPELGFDTIQFATDAPRFSDEALVNLKRTAAIMLDFPTVHVEIRGYSDNLGTDNLGGSRSVSARAYHLSVSLRRAEAVRNFLIDQGIDEARLRVNAFGQDAPVAPNLTPEGRKMNRRVEIIQIR